MLLYYTWLHTFRYCFIKSVFGITVAFLLYISNVYLYNRYNTAKDSTKYILLWTNPNESPHLKYLDAGSKVFYARKCEWKNCYVTSDRNFFGNNKETRFNVIVFNGPQLPGLLHKIHTDLPLHRSVSQSYVYANFEAVVKSPKLDAFWNNYFNLTWTYKLDSDIHWRYLLIRNASHHIIGPQKEIKWIKLENMNYLRENVKKRLKYKKKAAAWFLTNCGHTQSKREYLVLKIHNALQNYGLKVDIFGECGSIKCPNYRKCLEILEKDYYFYLAFEEVLNEDYITEILLPLQHNLVPVVFGRANYSRFLPEAVYLDASKLTPEEVASKMNGIMQFPKIYYYNMFKWKNHYSYHHPDESSDSDNYCQFCAQLNMKESKNKIMKNLINWWET